jgi:hypothetical protein
MVHAMDAGVWLILTVILKSGTPYVVAWPAPSIERCEYARTFIPQPTQSETRCSDERPKADLYSPELPFPQSPAVRVPAAKAEALERDLVAEIPRLKPGPAVQ